MAMQQSSKTSVAEGAAVRPAQCARVQARRTVQVSAKYGEGSKYFDLKVRSAVAIGALLIRVLPRTATPSPSAPSLEPSLQRCRPPPRRRRAVM